MLLPQVGTAHAIVRELWPGEALAVAAADQEEAAARGRVAEVCAADDLPVHLEANGLQRGNPCAEVLAAARLDRPASDQTARAPVHELRHVLHQHTGDAQLGAPAHDVPRR
ncbi:hypothetical protein G6F59_016165 [Rhizopus arrhizus]|nr:hypothetical protein G6F59_016165 [Rhizopus arrhizus]